MKGKETIGKIEGEFMQTLKFESLDGWSVKKNVSGKRMGKEGNGYAHKLHKMFECLDIILNSYHCYLDLKAP